MLDPEPQRGSIAALEETEYRERGSIQTRGHCEVDVNTYFYASLGIFCFECFHLLHHWNRTPESNSDISFFLLLLPTNGDNVRSSGWKRMVLNWAGFSQPFSRNGYVIVMTLFVARSLMPLSRSLTMMAGKYCRWYTHDTWTICHDDGSGVHFRDGAYIKTAMLPTFPLVLNMFRPLDSLEALHLE